MFLYEHKTSAVTELLHFDQFAHSDEFPWKDLFRNMLNIVWGAIRVQNAIGIDISEPCASEQQHNNLPSSLTTYLTEQVRLLETLGHLLKDVLAGYMCDTKPEKTVYSICWSDLTVN